MMLYGAKRNDINRLRCVGISVAADAGHLCPIQSVVHCPGAGSVTSRCTRLSLNQVRCGFMAEGNSCAPTNNWAPKPYRHNAARSAFRAIIFMACKIWMFAHYMLFIKCIVICLLILQIRTSQLNTTVN